MLQGLRVMLPQNALDRTNSQSGSTSGFTQRRQPLVTNLSSAQRLHFGLGYLQLLRSCRWTSLQSSLQRKLLRVRPASTVTQQAPPPASASLTLQGDPQPLHDASLRTVTICSSVPHADHSETTPAIASTSSDLCSPASSCLPGNGTLETGIAGTAASQSSSNQQVPSARRVRRDGCQHGTRSRGGKCRGSRTLPEAPKHLPAVRVGGCHCATVRCQPLRQRYT